MIQKVWITVPAAPNDPYQSFWPHSFRLFHAAWGLKDGVSPSEQVCPWGLFGLDGHDAETSSGQRNGQGNAVLLRWKAFRSPSFSTSRTWIFLITGPGAKGAWLALTVAQCCTCALPFPGCFADVSLGLHDEKLAPTRQTQRNLLIQLGSCNELLSWATRSWKLHVLLALFL